MISKVAFTMYPVRDPARARAFYETTLGLRRGSAAPNGDWTEYDLPGGGCLALFRDPEAAAAAADGPAPKGGASVALEVDDLDAEIARLEGAGVAFDHRMIHSPVCRMSIIRDSEGNSLILHQLHPKKPKPA